MDDERDRTTYCGNLASETTEEILYELFLQAGPLERVVIPKDKDGKKRTFGFVTFKHAVSVPYAIELFNGISLFKRQLKLQARSNSSDSSPHLLMHKRSYSCPSPFIPPGPLLNTPKNDGAHEFSFRNSNHKNNRNLDIKEELRHERGRTISSPIHGQCSQQNMVRFNNNNDSSKQSNYNFSQERSQQQRNTSQTGMSSKLNFSTPRSHSGSSSSTGSTRYNDKRSLLEQDLERQMHKRLKLLQTQEHLKAVASMRLQQNLFPQNFNQYNSPWLFPHFRR